MMACSKHSLLVAQSIFRKAAGVKSQWFSYYENKHIPNLFEGPSLSDATECSSFVFSTSNFKYKKRKSRADISTLALLRKLLDPTELPSHFLERKKYPNGYPGSAPSSNPEMPRLYLCHTCKYVFPPISHNTQLSGAILDGFGCKIYVA